MVTMRLSKDGVLVLSYLVNLMVNAIISCSTFEILLDDLIVLESFGHDHLFRRQMGLIARANACEKSHSIRVLLPSATGVERIGD